ncbi:hypothetical protein [Mesobacillus harenae]|nr:hypothetical protein [Mesobacillus harenae]
MKKVLRKRALQKNSLRKRQAWRSQVLELIANGRLSGKQLPKKGSD